MHQLMATTLDRVVADIRKIQNEARTRGFRAAALADDGAVNAQGLDRSEGRGRPEDRGDLPRPPGAAVRGAQQSGTSAQLEQWLRSYRADELFDATGQLRAELAALAPRGTRRMGANPQRERRTAAADLRMPDFREYAVAVAAPGAVDAEDTGVLGKFLRDVIRLNQEPRHFRLFGPDEIDSNRLGAVFEVTDRQWTAARVGRRRSSRPAGQRHGGAERASVPGVARRATCSPGAMDCSPPTKRSSTSSTRCSTSTRSG